MQSLGRATREFTRQVETIDFADIERRVLTELPPGALEDWMNTPPASGFNRLITEDMFRSSPIPPRDRGPLPPRMPPNGRMWRLQRNPVVARFMNDPYAANMRTMRVVASVLGVTIPYGPDADEEDFRRNLCDRAGVSYYLAGEGERAPVLDLEETFRNISDGDEPADDEQAFGQRPARFGIIARNSGNGRSTFSQRYGGTVRTGRITTSDTVVGVDMESQRSAFEERLPDIQEFQQRLADQIAQEMSDEILLYGDTTRQSIRGLQSIAAAEPDRQEEPTSLIDVLRNTQSIVSDARLTPDQRETLTVALPRRRYLEMLRETDHGEVAPTGEFSFMGIDIATSDALDETRAAIVQPDGTITPIPLNEEEQPVSDNPTPPTGTMRLLASAASEYIATSDNAMVTHTELNRNMVENTVEVDLRISIPAREFERSTRGGQSLLANNPELLVARILEEEAERRVNQEEAIRVMWHSVVQAMTQLGGADVTPITVENAVIRWNPHLAEAIFKVVNAPNRPERIKATDELAEESRNSKKRAGKRRINLRTKPKPDDN